MSIVTKFTAKAALVATAAAVVAASAVQAEDLTIRFGHRWAANHYIQLELVDPFFKAVGERTGGAVKFENYPAAQLGGDLPGTLSSGLLDIGLIATGSHPDMFPLTSVGELPQAAATACEGSARIGALVKPGGILDEQEWKPQGLRVLSASMLAPYGLFSRDFKIDTLEAVAGKKVWASGPAAEVAIRALNAVPIRIPSTELYDSATRGTIDAAIFPYSGLIQYDLPPILNNSVHGVNLGSGVFFMAITQADWDALSEENRKILEEEAAKAEKSFCEYIDRTDSENKAKAASTPGFVVTDLEGENLAKIDAVLRGVGDTWAENFDKAGRDGSGALAAHRAVKVE